MYDFRLFPKLKLPLKERRLRQTWRGSWWQSQKRTLQMVLKSGRNIGISLWGPKRSNLKGIRAPFSTFFNIKWLDTFQTDLISTWEGGSMLVVIHFCQGCPSLPVIFTDPQYLSLIPHLLKGINSSKFGLGCLPLWYRLLFSGVDSQFLNWG